MVRSTSGPLGSEGTETPMAFRMLRTLLTSLGATWLVSRVRFSVTFSAGGGDGREDVNVNTLDPELSGVGF